METLIEFLKRIGIDYRDNGEQFFSDEDRYWRFIELEHPINNNQLFELFKFLEEYNLQFYKKAEINYTRYGMYIKIR